MCIYILCLLIINRQSNAIDTDRLTVAQVCV